MRVTARLHRTGIGTFVARKFRFDWFDRVHLDEDDGDVRARPDGLFLRRRMARDG